jgi:alkylated DNA nucleotide flippase Atl1
MNSFHYGSDLIGGSLQVRESRIVADLLLQDASPEQWHEVIQQQNRLQKRAPASAKRVAQAIRKRLERLDAPFWRAIRDGDDELATQVVFCSALERNLLLVEFIETVLKDAFVTRAGVLEPYHWNEFLDERSHRDSTITTWTESSRKKMAQVVYRMLAEVGLLKSTRNMKLQKLMIRSEVRVLLDDSYRYRIKACLEVSNATGQ